MVAAIFCVRVKGLMDLTERDQLKRLRAYLERPPTTHMERQSYFANMHRLLEGFRPEVFRQEIFDEVRQALERPELEQVSCIAHPAWIRAFFEGAQVPQLMLVTSFSLDERSSKQALRTFLQAPWPRLRQLSLMKVRFEPESAACFDELPAQLPALRSFQLYQPAGPSAVFEAIARWSPLAAVEQLSLSLNGQLTAAVAQRLAERALPLRRLYITDSEPSSEALGLLLCSQTTSQLEQLHLGSRLLASDPRGDQLVAALARAAAPAQLRELGLVWLGLTAAACASLSQSPALAGLKVLDLTHNYGVAREGVASIAASFKALETLRLKECGINAQSIIPLTEPQALPSLKTLELGASALYSDEIELWTDWDGTVVGEGLRRMTSREIKQRYFSHRPNLQVR